MPFWDLVVLCCSADPRTEAAFRRCVAALELPTCAEYRVLPDPPGPKIEGGGATMHALERLRDEFGDRMDKLRVMIIQAGESEREVAGVGQVTGTSEGTQLGSVAWGREEVCEGNTSRSVQ